MCALWVKTCQMWVSCYRDFHKKDYIIYNIFSSLLKKTRQWGVTVVKELVIVRGETFHSSFHKFLLPTAGLGAKGVPQGLQVEEACPRRSCRVQFCRLPGLANSERTQWRRRERCWTLPLGGAWQWTPSACQRDCSHRNWTWKGCWWLPRQRAHSCYIAGPWDAPALYSAVSAPHPLSSESGSSASSPCGWIPPGCPVPWGFPVSSLTTSQLFSYLKFGKKFLLCLLYWVFSLHVDDQNVSLLWFSHTGKHVNFLKPKRQKKTMLNATLSHQENHSGDWLLVRNLNVWGNALMSGGMGALEHMLSKVMSRQTQVGPTVLTDCPVISSFLTAENWDPWRERAWRVKQSAGHLVQGKAKSSNHQAEFQG